VPLEWLSLSYRIAGKALTTMETPPQRRTFAIATLPTGQGERSKARSTVFAMTTIDRQQACGQGPVRDQLQGSE